jgi:hypothetical protein
MNAKGKKFLYLIIGVLLMMQSFSAKSQQEFDSLFELKTLRIDFSRVGDKDSSWVILEQIKKEPFWGGSKNKLIDNLDLGDYYFELYDSTTNTLIYSRGYSSLFREWLDTDEAKSLKRGFYESIIMPFPKKTVKLVLLNRNWNNTFDKVFEYYINPKDYFIKQEQIPNYEVKTILNSGLPESSLDITILSEGYAAADMPKFEKDCYRFMGYFFEVSPFKENKAKINFHIVESISQESGTDIPGQGVWKNTILNSSFYTFNSERYLTTLDIKSVRDIAACAPYDQIFILVNTAKYGGGGIYNYYNLCSSDHPQSKQVFTHEFGHGFGALADEYAYEDTPAETLYNLNIEPWQRNISTLANFSEKWSDLVKNTPIPTPDIEKYKKSIGAFEGAGYVMHKIYRPMRDCKMRSNNTDEFCPVCKRSLLEVLSLYIN